MSGVVAYLAASGTIATTGTVTALGGGSVSANPGDGNTSKGIRLAKPATAKFGIGNVTLPSGAVIDFVQLVTYWSTASSVKGHFSAWIGVNNKEYKNDLQIGRAHV